MYPNNLKEETKQFLRKYVFPRSKFSFITNENADEIVDFIEHTYIVPLAADLDEKIRTDQELLKAAENAVDDICEN